MSCRKRIVVAACATVLSSHEVTRATDYLSTWNATAASWSDAANWLNTPSIVAYPNNNGSNTFETIVNGVGVDTTQLTLSENITVSSLGFSNAALIGGSSSGAGFSVTVLGAFNNNGGNFRLSSGAILNLGGVDTITGSTTIDGDTNSALNVQSTGAFTVAGPGLAAVSVPFNNSGFVSVTAGTLSLQGGGSGAGSFTVASGATLETVGNSAGSTFTGGVVNNNGLLNIARLSNATFTTISGTGTLTIPSYPTTLSVNSITQGTMNVDGGTINLLAPSAVTNLTITSLSASPNFNGSAPDNTTAPSSTVSLTVNGVFNGSANFTLNKGIILNLAGTGSFSGNNVDGGTNAQINIQPGAVIQHNVSSATYIDDALTTVNGELDVTAGSFNIDYGGTHAGTFNVSAGAFAGVGGAFSSTANVTTAGSFYIIPSAGADSDPALPAYTGHNFNGTLNVQAGGTLGFQGVGLPQGAVFFTNQSNVTMGPTTTLNSVSGSTVLFKNQQALNIGTVTVNGGVTYRNTGLSVGTYTNINYSQIETGGTASIGTLNMAGGIMRSGYEDNLPTTVSVGTFNLSGGSEGGLIVVNNAMNWTGGIIADTYGHVIVQPNASLNVAPGAGTISQNGRLDISGQTYFANNLNDAGGDNGVSTVNFSANTTTINGNLTGANTGTTTSGSATAQVTFNVAAPATVTAREILLGNSNGGDAELKTAGIVRASGIQMNDVTVTAGTLSVTTDTNASDNIDPELNGSLVGGYLRNGQLNVNGGVVSAPYMKLGISSGSTGTFTQTAGSVNLGTLSGGNDGNLNSGSGIGMIAISGGSDTFGTVLLASTAGGAADMNISGTANITIGGGGNAGNGGGAHLNDITVDGGTLTVLAQAAPAGEDSELYQAIVGGYLTDGQLNVNGGTVTTPYLKLGITSGNTGTFTQTGGTVNIGTLSGGDDANLNSGSGTGMINISGGTLVVGTVLLASTAGGSGDMTISGTANVTIGGGGNTGGGAHLNDLTLDGGTLTILDQIPPAGEDGELNRALVGGYLTSGAFNVYAGVASTPYIKLGITSGMTGTFIQQGGTVSVGTLCVGNDVTTASGSGIGSVVLSGNGALSIGTLQIGSTAGGVGTMSLASSAAVRITHSMTMVPGQSSFTMSGGSLTFDGATASLANSSIPIGDGTQSATLHLHDSILSGTAAGLTIAAHATLDGGGGDLAGESTGSVALSGTSLSLSGSNSILHMAIGGDPTVAGSAGNTFDQITESNGVFTTAGATLQLVPIAGLVYNKPYPIIVTAVGGVLNYAQVFSNLTIDPTYAGSGLQYSVAYTPTAIDVTFSVPEPACGAGLLLGLGGVLFRRRRSPGRFPA